ncbi:SulP family inorganic anion transporter [Deminuibacter soli]|uniref:SulP family inorganic anion transporter n=1 Tax=Deminuibacter soli TaxID=2291815 RepID=A0A3E1NQL2_9BACT|nr:SulP family inorganic anion transporter [Deminuibacter soli]RFM30215.1 SulP family inorganic anion transporter [Deminuibacter soli]
MKKFFSNAGYDIPASIVVFLVALPLCLGVAQASGAPLFSGIIAGMVGGISIGLLSKSQLSVAGPAAGLTAIVAAALLQMPYQSFLVAVVIAGALQIVLGLLKAGIIGDFIPNAVIKGMLAAIGLILILKEIPHLVGYDKDYIGDESFSNASENTFSGITHALRALTPGAVIIGLVSVGIILLWETKLFKHNRVLKLVPAPLIVVAAGILMNMLFMNAAPQLVVGDKHLVHLPVAEKPSDFLGFFTMPDFASLFSNAHVITTGVTLAIVASLETLLSIEAIDKLDPYKRVTPTNRELLAQGTGNMISGLLGGLPVTSVIVRSSANVNAGAKSKMATIGHGVLLLLCVLFIAPVLNLIPNAALAAILILTGYKLAKPQLFIALYKKGIDQIIPFVVTIAAILFTDLLKGIVVGIVVGLYFMLRSNFRSSVFVVRDENKFLFRLRKDVSFLNKSLIKNKLEEVPANSYIMIDASRADFIDKDIIDVINEFMQHAPLKKIRVELRKSEAKPMHRLIKLPGQAVAI